MSLPPGYQKVKNKTVEIGWDLKRTDETWRRSEGDELEVGGFGGTFGLKPVICEWGLPDGDAA